MFSLVVLLTAPISAKAAEAAATRALIAGNLGPKIKCVKNGLGYTVGQPLEKGAYHVQFVTPAGAYDVYVRAGSGKVENIYRTAAPKGRKQTWPTAAIQRERVKNIARRLDMAAPLGVRGRAGSPPDAFTVAELARGQRVFVGPYANGASISLDAKGRMTMFQRHQTPVTCPPATAVLPPAEALRRYKESFNGRLVRFTPKRPPELIYYSPDGSPAKLAWYLPADIGVDVGHAIHGVGNSSVVIDAANGKPIRLPIQFSDPF